MWRWKLAARAIRDLENLPEKAATAALEAIQIIAENPYRLGKPLKFEYEGSWVARRGPYRIIYRIDSESQTVEVATISHRSDAYGQPPT